MSGFVDSRKPPIKLILIGTAIAIAVTLVLMCIICIVMQFTSALPYPLLPYILLIADAGGVFCGAYFIGAINKSSGLMLGVLCAIIMFVLLLIAGLSTGETVSILTLIKPIVMIVSGMIGGILGVNKKEKIRIK